MTVKIRRVILLSLLIGLLMSAVPMLSPHSYADAYVSEEMADVPQLLKSVKDGERYPSDEEIRDIVLGYWRTVEGIKGRYWNGLTEDSEYWKETGFSYSEKKASEALIDLTGSGKVENLARTVTDKPSKAPSADKEKAANIFAGAGCLDKYDSWDTGFASYMLYLIYGNNSEKNFEKFDEYNEETGEPQPGDCIRCVYDDSEHAVEHTYVIYQIVGRRAYIIEADVPFGTGRINKCVRAIEDVKADVHHEPIELPWDYQYWTQEKREAYDNAHKKETFDGYFIRIKPKDTYFIEYEPNKGSGAMDPEEVLRNNLFQLAENGYKRDGYVFVGWNTRPDGSGKSYTNMEEVLKLAKSGETVKLYAQWKKNEAALLSEKAYNKSCVAYPTNIQIEITDPDGVSVMSLPCVETENENSQELFRVKSGEIVSATRLLRNYNEEYWYYITRIDGTQGYVYAGDTRLYGPVAEPIEFSGTDITADQEQGQYKRLPGKLKAKENVIITAVRATLHSLEKIPGTEELRREGASSLEETGLNDSRFTMAESTLDKRLYFAALPAGDCRYTLDVEYKVCYSEDGKTFNAAYYSVQRSSDFKEIATYTVEYNANGHGVTGYVQSTTHKTDAYKSLRENNFSRKGYTFAGWNTAPDGTGAAFADEEKVVNLREVNGDTVTLFAQWIPNTYKVNFHANGGKGSMDEITLIYDQETVLPKNRYTREDYLFKSWCLDKDGSGKDYTDGGTVKNLTTNNNDTLTLYAQWIETPEKRVNYDANGGEGAPEGSVWEKGTIITISDQIPTRKGYTFKGWKENDKSTLRQPGEMLTVNEHLTFSAVWEGNHYSIRFEGNGPSDRRTSDVIFGNESVLKNEFTYRFHTFTGWNTAADGSGVAYEPDQTVSELTYLKDGEERTFYADESEDEAALYPGNTFVLYAQWTRNETFFLSYDFNGGTGKPIEAQEGEYGDELPVAKKTGITRTGYTFMGWDEDKDLKIKEKEPEPKKPKYTGDGGESLKITKDTVLYAIWKPNQYIITFYAFTADGGNMDPITCTYDVSRKLPANKYYRSGYSFLCWNTKSNGTGKSYADGEMVINLAASGNANLYAQWEKNPTYTVSFDANGGEKAPKEQSINEKSFKLTEQKPSRAFSTLSVEGDSGEAAYDFLGWAEEANATAATYIPGETYDISGDLTLFAVWKQNFYTLELIVGEKGDNDVDAESGTVYSYAIRNSGDYTPKTINALGWLLPDETNWPIKGTVTYYLDGWYTAPRGAGTKVTGNTPMDQSYGPLYPYWIEGERPLLTGMKAAPKLAAPAPTPAMSFIESGEVEIRIPAVWGTFENAAESLKDGCDVTVEWRLASDKSSVEGRTAQYETNYEAFITLTAQEGYLFKNNTTIPVSVNGLKLDADVLSSGEAQIVYAYRTENELNENAAAPEAEDEAAPAAGVRERLRADEQQKEQESAGGSVVYGRKTITGNEVTTEEELRAALAGRASSIVITKDLTITEDLVIPAIYTESGASYGTDIFITADVTIDNGVRVENYGCLHLTASGNLTVMPRATLYLSEPTVNIPIQMSLEGGQLWGRSDHIVNCGRITIDADSYMRNDFYSLSNFIGEKDLSVTISLYPSDVISFVNDSKNYKKVTVKVIGQETWELKDDFTIPENCQISFSNVSKMILDKGVTLTNFGSLLLTYGYPDAVLCVSEGAEFINYGYLDSASSVIYE